MERNDQLPTIAFWLLPAREPGDYLRRLVRDLAVRYDAPVFEPHVTLHAGPASSFESPVKVIETVAHCSTVTLEISGIQQSEQFTKTVFVGLKTNLSIELLAEKLRNQSREASRYELKPHLSLIYKHLTEAPRTELAGSIALPFGKIEFDSVCAVAVPDEHNSRIDVESWREAAPVGMLRPVT